MEPEPGCYRICLASDFFFPNMGGVELHQYQISHFLVKHGHKVVIITHQYGERDGVRVLKNGIKVYYIPLLPVFNECVFPTAISEHSLIRNILVRERIEIFHAHQSFSSISLTTMDYARLLGIRVFMTEHSLFGLKGLSSILLNTVLQYSLANSDGAVAVSHCTKENLCLRGKCDPCKIYVIPNALESSKFLPNPDSRDPNCITIVILSRLVYRKGVDLAVGVIPKICTKYPNANFIIGGDGPMMLNFEEMRERYRLQSRVKLLGAVQHCETRNVLIQGDIFLNCSLTEGFCIAIIEALSCGLHVVSTHVGGVPEVLPNNMIKYAMPTVEDVYHKIEELIPTCKEKKDWEFHNAVKKFYSWEKVATRTENMYRNVLKTPHCDKFEHIHKMYYEGVWSGPFLFFLHWFALFFQFIFEIFWPKDTMEKAYEIPRKYYKNGLIMNIGVDQTK
ncbi:phosphatidylinositol N-acetylglucosaminyltransferase subunit A, putative [Entamoeba invadens IP1]|uniref:phosphatidylinositol N-acetylglucosaminyltransferase n=1 Tax=Entamoeba invadens IP1 TaxID=370355 RepID=A0A0A1UB82_ENTIV|nr:phosphatidylinositol N-acetylglucosaminyltransferase subunit A, putative [Entamoeba invadens IP1]ELP89461.1 phosphatidylinositol N-acetylglucosaminyltransferase subunit A, putative [Entamoeba invadens IP1]|eukprot:XP_004256232.1 phosphatidylinositol N-acetylglucosaminyltransferase subunit A, putative [Entamoeba invadens IP1]